jgi:general secretion pathway protein L
MATRILGIDLGAYSVKVTVASPGFRQVTVTDVIERLVPPGDEPHEVRAVRELAALIREHKLDDDVPFVAVSGDELFLHILEFPFKSLRRSELEKVVGGELEGILPLDLEDMVYSFEVLPPIGGDEPVPEAAPDAVDLGEPLDDEPTNVQVAPSAPVMQGMVAPPTTGMRVLACAMRKERARHLLDLLRQNNIDARGLIAAPGSYMRVIERLTTLKEGLPHAPVALVDIGHEHTNVCVVKDGKVVFMRTLSRGGRDITAAISDSWRLDWAAAEQAKHQDGFIASSRMPASSEAWERISAVVVDEAAPLARELRQTFTACLAKTGARVERIEVVGGGSRLRGLPEYLSEQLALDVTSFDADDAARVIGDGGSSRINPDAACLAAGVAFEGSSGRAHFDLRQGELAFKADLSFLRGQATKLAAMLLVVVAFAAGNAYAALYNLRKAEKVLNERLVLETTDTFGRSMSASEAINAAESKTGPGATGSPLPKMTAYDIILDINKRLPTQKEIKVDVSDIDIKRNRITIKAETFNREKTDSLPELRAIDGPAAIVKRLKTQECFTDVQRGNITAGRDDSKKFSITITSKCM